MNFHHGIIKFKLSAVFVDKKSKHRFFRTGGEDWYLLLRQMVWAKWWGWVGLFHGGAKNCSWYYTASLFHDNPFLYHPCMVYLPTCSWFLWEKWGNIPYMDAMGFLVGNFCCSSFMFIFRKAWEPIHILLPTSHTLSNRKWLHCSKGISTPLKL